MQTPVIMNDSTGLPANARLHESMPYEVGCGWEDRIGYSRDVPDEQFPTRTDFESILY